MQSRLHKLYEVSITQLSLYLLSDGSLYAESDCVYMSGMMKDDIEIDITVKITYLHSLLI